MKICPTCREEFLDHIESCVTCDDVLVSEQDAKSRPMANATLSKEELLAGETATFLEGSLMHCREIEKMLTKSKISSVVYPVSLQSSANAATLGAASDMKYMLLVRASDVDLAKAALEGQFYDQVAKEGKGNFVREVVDLSADVITCPACGETAPLRDGECVGCGLGLGPIEPQGQKTP